MDWFLSLNSVTQALIGTLFTWFMTALGAAMVFFFKEINQKVLNAMLGFAAGVMIAASYWSLLAPAIDMASEQGRVAWIPAAGGFLAGGIFLWVVDKIMPHLHLNEDIEHAEGIKTNFGKSALLVFAITLHNIPEGMAVGVAFGAVANQLGSTATVMGAIALAIGIGIQNFPEGAAVSIPLRREGNSRMRSFMYGQASGIVEPMAAVVGAYAVTVATNILPFALSFAAGAMIYVVVEELIPEAQSGHDTHFSTLGVMVGFVVMMILDVALG